jgi:hypothetical protein
MIPPFAPPDGTSNGSAQPPASKIRTLEIPSPLYQAFGIMKGLSLYGFARPAPLGKPGKRASAPMLDKPYNHIYMKTYEDDD